MKIKNENINEKKYDVFSVVSIFVIKLCINRHAVSQLCLTIGFDIGSWIS